MSKLTETGNHIRKLPDDYSEAIIGLIDIKTEGDMERVLQKLDSMNETFNARFKALEEKVGVKFDALNHKISAVDHKIAAIYWFIGAIVTLAVALTRILPFFHL